MIQRKGRVRGSKEEEMREGELSWLHGHMNKRVPTSHAKVSIIMRLRVASPPPPPPPGCLHRRDSLGRISRRVGAIGCAICTGPASQA